MRRENLMAIELTNDNLRKFISNWNGCLLEMSEYVDDGLLSTLFYKQVKRSTLMEEPMKQHQWQRWNSGDDADDHDYTVLYNFGFACLGPYPN